MNKKIILLIGPTATGKTRLSIQLAKHLHTEIVNADSLLFYKELSIGVAKPSAAQIREVTHHLIDISSVNNSVNAMDFCNTAIPIIRNFFNKHENKPIIICGGSGFYIRALLLGMYDSPTTSKEIAYKSEMLYKENGIEPFLNILKINDEETFKKLHTNDHYRIRRAVEHWWMTQTPLSISHKIKMEQNLKSPFWKKEGWKILPLYIDIPKNQHQLVIESRTEQMIQEGLIDEVKKLLEQFSGNEKPLQSIGYKEVQQFLNGNITSIEKLKEEIIISTRQLAKSQRTWFANMEKVELKYPNFFEESLPLIDKFLHSQL